MTPPITVGSALEAWRERSGCAPRQNASRLFWVRVGALSIPIPNPGQLDWHDLHHLLLGYDTDLTGEMEVSAFELRTIPRTPIVFLLCVAGVLAGLVWAPRRTLAAWKRAKGWRNLYGSGLDYGSVLVLSMEDLLLSMKPGAHESFISRGSAVSPLSMDKAPRSGPTCQRG